MAETLPNTSPELSRILIDGCFVPTEIFTRVKAHARKTSRTQFIGVLRNVPVEQLPAPSEQPWDWAAIMKRVTAMRLDMASGENLVYVLDQTRDELLLRDDLLMVLWITPFD